MPPPGASSRRIPTRSINPAGGWSPNDYFHCPQGIGPTYDEHAVVLCPRPGTIQAWHLEGDPVPIDITLDDRTDVRMAALVAPGRWLYGVHHWIASPQVPSVDFWIEEPQVMRISPSRDRVVVVGNAQLDGVVVLDSTLALAYYVDELTVYGGLRVGASFSADGGTLYAAAQSRDTMQVAAVAADDGEVLGFRTIESYGGNDLLADAHGRYVFVLGSTPEHRTVLIVLTAATLEAVAEIGVPDAACGRTIRPGLVQDQTLDRVYAIWASGEWQSVPPANSCIEWFDVW